MLLPVATTLTESPLRAWSVLGPVYLRLVDLSSTSFTPVQLSLLATTRLFVGPFEPAAIDTAVTWLDQGAHKAVFHTTYAALLDGGIALDLPKDRVLLSIALTDAEARDVASLAMTLPALASVTTGILLQPASRMPFDALLTLRKALPEAFYFAVDGTASDVAPWHAQHINLLATPASEDDVTAAFIACLRSDRSDGLYTTVVTDTSGVALGLVYSSADSIAASVCQRRGIYYSRSRRGLWPKGDSSGHVQELVQLDMDCDSDALRFTVLQHGPEKATTPDNGAFCHLETRTCWGAAGGVRHLQATLQDRKQSAPPGSYTKRLFDDMELLRNKLVEEAQELAEATDPVHVAEEGADVLYFAMARCVAAGVSFQDVEHQLNLRARKLRRRPGNAKAYRIDAANAILAKEPGAQ
ncbi:histidine biosynthesis trifunctional protein [Achlya hypogyna]|uniref:Histidine biosynthesis trifunctional protein n=1 Tax=Achlya hypogyna TaxID=1202772 RepID=A0A1V9YDV7_ACHHY|nr:histidine biosynthesis trifunctional protein [Achlya hypogyna]